MKNKNLDENNAFNDIKNLKFEELQKQIKYLKKKYYTILSILIISLVINLMIIKTKFFGRKGINQYEKAQIKLIPNIVKENDENNYDYIQDVFKKEKKRLYLNVLNKKRTFAKRYPLNKKIKCIPHLTKNELIAFLSFLTNDTIFFETGSGCSSIIAKNYVKKSYSIEGGKDWYEIGIKNGLKENLVFHDLKPDNPIWSKPGKNSTMEDWKKYFQSYNKSYNANVILLDGRFKVATAMDIFDKIDDNTIVLIHEYTQRQIYFILDEYYQYIYHWDSLTAFVKKKGIKSIPLEIQKQYWDKYY